MADDDWELQPVDAFPFEGRVTPPPAGDPYAHLTPDQLRAIGAPTMESYSPSLAQGLGDTANRGLQALGASRGYSQEFGSKLSTLANFAPGVGDISAAQDSLKSGSPGGAAANVLGMFLGPGAKLANLGKLERAMALAKQGWDADSIRMTTGWHKGAEGGWRFEVPDTGLRVDPSKLTPPSADPAQTTPIRQVVEHPALFASYPELGQYRVEAIAPGSVPSSVQGWHDMQDKVIGIRPEQSPEELRSVMSHELQHAVQTREGFEEGANASTIKGAHPGMRDVEAFDAYRRNAGEVEARNTQTRLNMTALQRMATGPSRTQDVPLARQLLSNRAKSEWTLEPVGVNPFGEEEPR